MSTNDVRVEIYRSFIEEQRAPSPDEVAGGLGLPLEEVRAAMRELHEQDVIALQPGSDLVWLAHPFCAVDASFEVKARGKRWDAICIWDALGTLEILDSDGEVSTSCPDCGEPLRVQVQDGQVQGDNDLVVHYGVPAARWYEDVAYT